MILWEKFIYQRLKRLASGDPKLNVNHAKKLLCAAWNASSVDFFSSDGEAIHGKSLLSNVLYERFTVHVGLEFPCEALEEAEDLDDTSEDGDNFAPIAVAPHANGETPPRRPLELVVPQPRTVDPLAERVISSLDAQERRRDFVWAGFVVKDLLPAQGIEPREAQTLFDRLVDEGVLLLEKRANPNNPDFKTTVVKLNRDNDAVQAVLARVGNSIKSFQPVPIRGEPASATLIRERR